MSEHIDWFNFMSYDIHGTWDENSRFTQAVINPHTNLTGDADFQFLVVFPSMLTLLQKPLMASICCGVITLTLLKWLWDWDSMADHSS